MAETDQRAELARMMRDILSTGSFDVTATLAVLNTLPDTMSTSVSEAVHHAQRAVAAAPGRDDRHRAVARYMVARVLASLDRTETTDAA